MHSFTDNSTVQLFNLFTGMKKWSPLEVHFMEHGIRNNLIDSIPPPITSWESPSAVRFIYYLHRRFAFVQRHFNPTSLRLLATYPFLYTMVSLLWPLALLLLFFGFPATAALCFALGSIFAYAISAKQ